jgi:hypothetical protein
MPTSTSAAPKQLSDANSQGTVLGQSATDTIGFFGATPVAQATPAANVHTVAAGSTTSVFVNTTFDGSVGSTAYTVGDLVAILKGLGLIKT